MNKINFYKNWHHLKNNYTDTFNKKVDLVSCTHHDSSFFRFPLSAPYKILTQGRPSSQSELDIIDIIFTVLTCAEELIQMEIFNIHVGVKTDILSVIYQFFGAQLVKVIFFNHTLPTLTDVQGL
jgi:hypothetical protein